MKVARTVLRALGGKISALLTTRPHLTLYHGRDFEIFGVFLMTVGDHKVSFCTLRSPCRDPRLFSFRRGGVTSNVIGDVCFPLRDGIFETSQSFSFRLKTPHAGEHEGTFVAEKHCCQDPDRKFDCVFGIRSSFFDEPFAVFIDFEAE